MIHAHPRTHSIALQAFRHADFSACVHGKGKHLACQGPAASEEILRMRKMPRKIRQKSHHQGLAWQIGPCDDDPMLKASHEAIPLKFAGKVGQATKHNKPKRSHEHHRTINHHIEL